MTCHPPAIFPPPLAQGSVIAIISPSSGSAGQFPSRLQRGLDVLESWGFRTRVMPNALQTGKWVSSSVSERVSDLHRAFSDPEIGGIISAIGGRGAAQLLGSIDFGLIKANPKVFCGYSDTTALHLAIGNETGLVTFYGPSLLNEIAECPAPFDETAKAFLTAVSGRGPSGLVPIFPRIVVEHVDWSIERPRIAVDAPTPEWVIEGSGAGPLAGGCLPVLCELLGTPWQRSFRGAILVLETPQLPYSMDAALADLWHVRNAGQLDGLAGMVVGWPFALDQLPDLVGAVREVVGRANYPVLVGAPFGHTSPMVTLPLGAAASLDADGLRIHANTGAP